MSRSATPSMLTRKGSTCFAAINVEEQLRAEKRTEKGHAESGSEWSVQDFQRGLMIDLWVVGF